MYRFFLFNLLICSPLLAQKHTFFPIHSHQVVLYLFNQEEIKSRPETAIYTEHFGYAKTIQQPGKELSIEQTHQLELLLSGKLYGLQDGLSKTYIPQHAFVFYNEKKEIIATINLGLDCGKVVFWKKEKGQIYVKEKFNEKKADELLKKISFLVNEIISYDSIKDTLK